VEEAQAKNKAEFANGFQTASDWLVAHERYVAFDKKFGENKTAAVRRLLLAVSVCLFVC
jgi:hypothetical protein